MKTARKLRAAESPRRHPLAVQARSLQKSPYDGIIRIRLRVRKPIAVSVSADDSTPVFMRLLFSTLYTSPPSLSSFFEKSRKDLFRHFDAKPLSSTFYNRIDRSFCKRLFHQLFFNPNTKRLCHSLDCIISSRYAKHHTHCKDQRIHRRRIDLYFFICRHNFRETIQIHQFLCSSKGISIILNNICWNGCCHSCTARCTKSSRYA